LVEVATSWKFNSDADSFRQISEAYRIDAAPLFEKFLAVRSSLIEPLPHQISAVYEKMLVPQPLRFVLADDPGAGKTIMTGLLLKELILRGDVQRCLIVCPGTLAEQWQDELRRKFQLPFEIATGEKINTAASENFFRDVNFCIAGLDMLARNKNFREKLYPHWDLIVCDEAHKMSATFQGNKLHATKRFRLGQLLGKITRHFLLLTATPHNGKEKDFYLFMSLVDPDRFAGAKRIQGPVDVSDIMRRLVKEDLLTFDGKPLFPERRAYTVNFSLSPQEAELYRLVTNYVVDGFNRAEQLTGNRKNSVGFAMTILQRRLASSPQAIFKSLERRTERLQKILRDKKISDKDDFDAEDWLEREEFPNGESELLENDLAERATSARTIAELRREIETLQKLTDAAKKNFLSGEDKKWRELSELLQVNKKFSKRNGGREKLIVFTEHRDTLDYLREKISLLFGRNEAVVTIHGGMNYNERHAVEKNFRQNEKVIVLVATDAAGEGINLQNAHLMINYDLPWNPNRLEQRFGRIHRIGQREVCHLWNLVANETREGLVFFRLLKKLEEERSALGGKVFDILGKISFNDKPLRELLIEAIRYGDDPKIIRRLDSVVDKTFDTDKLRTLLRERALTEEILDAAQITDITQKIERSDIYKLQPYFVENFFPEAFRRLGGQIFKRGKGRYEITHVPAAVRDKAAQNHSTLPDSFKRICFDKKFSDIAGVDPAEFVALGHPLLKSVCLLTLEKFGDILKRGTIFVDDNDDGENFRLLFCVENELQDGRQVTVSKRLHFLEISRDGQTFSTNHAPYLDYRSPTTAERQKILSDIKGESWLAGNLDELA
ncbi:MAG: DEAD/DEAH box helicase, partial [Selenomonadaceae bacterium]|nr:DEAD/DEAH box helicase [Selenomonadaceae bacterium]